MKTLVIPAIFTAFLLASTPAHAEYTFYENPTFGTIISYPDDMFEWQEELPTEQSGVLFSSDDRGSMAVFSYEAIPDVSPKEIAASIRANTNDNFNITYERVTKNWMVQSGYQDDLIYYQRIEFSPTGNIHGMLLKYPQNLRAKYDRHIGQIARSLKGN